MSGTRIRGQFRKSVVFRNDKRKPETGWAMKGKQGIVESGQSALWFRLREKLPDRSETVNQSFGQSFGQSLVSGAFLKLSIRFGFSCPFFPVGRTVYLTGKNWQEKGKPQANSGGRISESSHS